MALDFLNTLGSLASPIASIISAIRGPQVQKPQMLPVPPGEQYANSIYAAIADPNNSLVKANTALNYQQGMNALQQQITEQQLADRRAIAMGRAPTYFDPERADQTVAYLTSRGAPQIQADARTQAINQLLQSAQGAAGFAGAQTGRNQNYLAQQEAYKTAMAQPQNSMMGRLSGGVSALNQILSMFGNQPQPAQTTQTYGPYQNPNVMRYSQ